VNDDAHPPPGTRAMRVFISYKRADRPRVALLADALQEAGHQVWWDAMIEGGAAFARRIEDQLKAADAVVVAWSAQSVGSDWVRDEAGHARDAGKLVPVTIDGAEPPLGFRQYHVVDLSRWKGDAGAPEFQAVLAGIVGAADGVPAPAPSRSRSRPVLTRRAALIGAGGAGVVAAGAAIGLLHPWSRAAADNSVAVLPFRNLSGDAAQAYFSDGLAEEVRAALTRNPSLRVAAPTSSNMLRDVPDAHAIGARLHVAHLLEGSVRKAGDMVRISAELIETATGFTSWSQDFERRLSDVFAIQSEIAATVADALAVRVAQPTDMPGGTRNAEAYDAYLRGRALFNSDEGEASDRAALALFESAVQLDPSYASAHAARSRSLAGIATQYATADTLKGLYDQAIAAARRAVELAPGLPAAHLALAFALFTGHLDFRGARQPFEQAASLGSGDADILLLYALYASKAGQAVKAADAVRRAVQLDRLNPRAWRAQASVAYAAGRYRDVLPPAQQSLALNPKISNAHAMIGNALFALGRFAEARAAYEAEPNKSFRLAGLAIVQHRLGDEKAAQQALADLVSELGDSALYQQAEIQAQWGKRDAALAALEKARVVGDSGLLYMPTDPMLQSLRGDPRYAQLLKAMGLA
jgi:TolB-like protein/Flp pilus assembly protein TadD